MLHRKFDISLWGGGAGGVFLDDDDSGVGGEGESNGTGWIWLYHVVIKPNG